jgi:hypothetical protein
MQLFCSSIDILSSFSAVSSSSGSTSSTSGSTSSTSEDSSSGSTSLTSEDSSSPPGMLCSEPTPTFSHMSPSIYTPSYETPNIWDCITVISDFPNTVPTHPFNILPCLAPEPFNLASLLHPWPYFSHHFTEFCPYCTDRDPTELWLTAWPHQTHVHTLEHSTFCYKHICPTHYPYGGNKRAK